MSTLTRTRSVSGRPATGRPASAGSLIRAIAPTSSWMVLGVQATGVVLIAGHAAIRHLSGESLALSPTSVVLAQVGALALVTVLAGLVRSAGCWSILRGAVLAGASRGTVRLAALGSLGLLVLLQLPAGIIFAGTFARTPGVVVSAAGGATGAVLDYGVTCLAVDVLGMLAHGAWRGRPTWASAALLLALVVGTPSLLGLPSALAAAACWLLPGLDMLTVPSGVGLQHLGWALLVGPGILTWYIARWEPGR